MIKPTKMQLFEQLDDARDRLWSVMNQLDASAMVNEAWNRRDFFAHIGGWEAVVFTAFYAHVAGGPASSFRFTTVDDTNADFVAARRSMTESDARLECEINRYAIKTLVQQIPDEDFDKPVLFPWGPNTVVEFFEEAIRHENGHADELVAMIQGKS